MELVQDKYQIQVAHIANFHTLWSLYEYLKHYPWGGQFPLYFVTTCVNHVFVWALFI